MTVTSCKNDTQDELNRLTEGTLRERILDSIYYYSKEVYYWNDAIPSYKEISPRKNYSEIKPDLTAFARSLYDLTQYKINPLTGIPYEFYMPYSAKYSFVEERNNTSQRAVSLNTIDRYLSYDLVSNDVGYIQLKSFPELNVIKSNLDLVFSMLESKDSRIIILDLRNNKGGYLETAEYLVNLLAPESLNMHIMYTECFNETLQSGNLNMLKSQMYLDNQGNPVKYNGRWATMADVDYSESANTHHFNKEGGITNIQKLYVITSYATASASEFVINVLRPHINLEVLGDKTFGKPVGTFAIKINKYDVYFANFLIKNSLGQAEYFDGILPNIEKTMNSQEDINQATDSIINSIINNREGPTRSQTIFKMSRSAQYFDNSHNIQKSGNIENRFILKK